MNAKDAVMLVLQNHRGRAKAVSRDALLMQVRAWGAEVTDRALRQTISDLRKEGELICSAGGVGGGYYLASDWPELTDFLESEIHPRAMDLLQTEKALRNAAAERWGEAFQTVMF